MIKLKLGERVIDVVSMKIRVGNNVVEVDKFDPTGLPIITNTYTERIEHPDGRVDVKVRVPCLNIAGQTKEV